MTDSDPHSDRPIDADRADAGRSSDDPDPPIATDSEPPIAIDSEPPIATDSETSIATDSETSIATDSEPPDDTDSETSIRSLIQRFVALFARDHVPNLDEIRKRTTIRDVVKYREIHDRLDSGWSVYPEIVQFGEESLSDALVFSHYDRSYDVILKPLDTFEPTENVEIYVFDRRSGTRRRTGRVCSTLTDALERTVVELTHEEYDPDAPYLGPVSWRLPDDRPDPELMTID